MYSSSSASVNTNYNSSANPLLPSTVNTGDILPLDDVSANRAFNLHDGIYNVYDPTNVKNTGYLDL